MSLPINTKEGAERRVEALIWKIEDKNVNDDVKNRARVRLQYWKVELEEHLIKEADDYIDFILDGLE